MVKKLIAGMLKKSEKKEEEVPDELPPISGDAPAEPAGPPPSEETVPDELPEIKEEPTPEHETQEVEAPHGNIAPQETEQIPQQAPDVQAPAPQEGFFSRLTHLIKTDKHKEKVLTQNLVNSMKESYTVKKEAQKTGLTPTDEQRVKRSIEEALGTLKLLEGKWRAQKMILDEDHKTLKEYEDGLKENEKKLKVLLKESKIYEEATPLILKNYIEVKNVSELYNAMRTLDERTYAAHVGKGKNDFADFLMPIDKGLSFRVKSLRSKASMIKVLEQFINQRKS